MQRERKKHWLHCLGLSYVHGEAFLYLLEDTIQSFSDQLVSGDIGVVLSSEGASLLFESGNSEGLFSSNLPAAIMFVSSDSSGTIPFASKLSPGQAAYHFLAGYQNGKFLPGYNKGPSAFDPLDLAKAFLAKIRISLSWYNHAYRKLFHHSNSKVDISKQSTRASYPADFKNYQMNSYFEISDNHPCFSCGGGTTVTSMEICRRFSK